MSRRHGPDDVSVPHDGAATSEKGTPVPVDLEGSPRAHGTVALFLAGPVIWTAHFLLVYLVVEAGCTGAGPGLRLFDPPVPAVATLAATAVAALACLATAVLSYRRWRSDHRGEPDDGGVEEAPPGDPLAFAGFLLSLLGVVTVLFVGVPALVLPAC